MDSSFDVEKVIRGYLPDIIHMSLATCSDGRPWVCEVHFAYDDQLNVYFRSKPSRRHSQEIATNPHVAANIVTQHTARDVPRGVYLEGTAELLADVDENHVAYKSLCDRLSIGPDILVEAQKEDGHKFYKITVSDFYVFDARESRPSQKYHLQWSKF